MTSFIWLLDTPEDVLTLMPGLKINWNTRKPLQAVHQPAEQAEGKKTNTKDLENGIVRTKETRIDGLGLSLQGKDNQTLPLPNGYPSLATPDLANSTASLTPPPSAKPDDMRSTPGSIQAPGTSSTVATSFSSEDGDDVTIEADPCTNSDGKRIDDGRSH